MISQETKSGRACSQRGVVLGSPPPHRVPEGSAARGFCGKKMGYTGGGGAAFCLSPLLSLSLSQLWSSRFPLTAPPPFWPGLMTRPLDLYLSKGPLAGKSFDPLGNLVKVLLDGAAAADPSRSLPSHSRSGQLALGPRKSQARRGRSDAGGGGSALGETGGLQHLGTAGTWHRSGLPLEDVSAQGHNPILLGYVQLRAVASQLLTFLEDTNVDL